LKVINTLRLAFEINFAYFPTPKYGRVTVKIASQMSNILSKLLNWWYLLACFLMKLYGSSYAQEKIK